MLYQLPVYMQIHYIKLVGVWYGSLMRSFLNSLGTDNIKQSHKDTPFEGHDVVVRSSKSRRLMYHKLLLP